MRRHLQANARRRRASEHKVHKRLRIVGGATAGKLLLSGRGETTRPMMEKVGHGQCSAMEHKLGVAHTAPDGKGGCCVDIWLLPSVQAVQPQVHVKAMQVVGSAHQWVAQLQAGKQ